MKLKLNIYFPLLMTVLISVTFTDPALGQKPVAPKMINTVKQKLAEGKQVVGGTVYTADHSCSLSYILIRCTKERKKLRREIDEELNMKERRDDK